MTHLEPHELKILQMITSNTQTHNMAYKNITYALHTPLFGTTGGSHVTT